MAQPSLNRSNGKYDKIIMFLFWGMMALLLITAIL